MVQIRQTVWERLKAIVFRENVRINSHIPLRFADRAAEKVEDKHAQIKVLRNKFRTPLSWGQSN